MWPHSNPPLSAILKLSLKREPKYLGNLAANLNPADSGDIVELPPQLQLRDKVDSRAVDDG
jgi:hypothetical protein